MVENLENLEMQHLKVENLKMLLCLLKMQIHNDKQMEKAKQTRSRTCRAWFALACEFARIPSAGISF